MTTLLELRDHPDCLAMKEALEKDGHDAACELLLNMISDGDRDWDAMSPGGLVQLFFLATGKEERAARVVI